MATSPRGTKAGRPKARSKTLRQAASLVFAVTAILPLLLFVWTVYYLGALSRLSAQVGLGVALATSLMGYYVFRGLIGQMSDLIAVIGKVLERSPAGPRASAEPLEETSEESAGGWAAPSSVPAAPPRLRRSAEPASPAPAEPLVLPDLGAMTEGRVEHPPLSVPLEPGERIVAVGAFPLADVNRSRVEPQQHVDLGA